jgi:CubicO group peptidase (beta-lactamase class C family)
MRTSRRALIGAVVGPAIGGAALAEVLAQAHRGAVPSEILRGLEIVRPGADTGIPLRDVSLGEALRALNTPSVGIALIDGGELLAWEARSHGDGAAASARTLYQAASLSKLVTAVAALRLVRQGRLDLERDVNADLISWRVPESGLTAGHPVTLRGLLSMTGGIGVPGYLGYEPGSSLPNLLQILDGVPPANSPPVRVEYVAGSRYAYSGGGYQIVQALIQDATGRPFADALQELVLRPVGMTDSLFAQSLPRPLAARAASGHEPPVPSCRAGGA